MKYIAIIFLFFFKSNYSIASDQKSGDYKYSQRFDLSGRIVGSIDPDPDGAGPLGYPATRTTYLKNGDQISTVEVGYLNNWKSEEVAPEDWGNDSFRVTTSKVYKYDSKGRKIVELSIGSDGVIFARTEFNYYENGRLRCQAERMSPERFKFSYVSSHVCVSRENSELGRDRVRKFEYDPYGNMVVEYRAVGTPLEQKYREASYKSGLMLDYLIDANGNRTEYRYDDLGRKSYTYYPSKSSSGKINASDYERLAYDKNGNVTKKRTRSGKSIYYTFDSLNRECRKSYSSSSTGCLVTGDAATEFHRYDTQGVRIHSRFKNHSGPGIVYQFDGLGRIVGEVNDTLGVSRSVSYELDAHGNRTRITHPDGKYFSYKYDSLDRTIGVGEYASTENLQSIKYSNRGMVQAISRPGSSVTLIESKHSSRIASIYHNVKGAVNDYKASFGYNPIGGVTQIDLSNDLYHYFGNENIEGRYETNGLNQYTKIAGKALNYDGNGNLSSLDGTRYLYDIENKLISISGATSASFKYDPLGRLARLKSSQGVYDFIYSDDKLILLLNAASSSPVHSRFVFGGGVDELVAYYSGGNVSSGSRRHILRDYMGSVVANTDSAGVVAERFSYDTFGGPKREMEVGFGYTGQLWLGEDIGLYSYKSRMYSPYIGRFMQSDSIGYKDDLNMYSYVRNDPVNLLDPTGEFACGAIYITAAIVVGKALIGAATSYAASKVTGSSNKTAMKQAAIGAGVGAVTAPVAGLVSSSVVKIGGSKATGFIVGNATQGAVSSAASQAAVKGSVSFSETAVASAIAPVAAVAEAAAATVGASVLEASAVGSVVAASGESLGGAYATAFSEAGGEKEKNED